MLGYIKLTIIHILASSGVSLTSGVLMSWGIIAGRVREGCQSAEYLLKQGLKQGLLARSEQIVKCGVGAYEHVTSPEKQAENHQGPF